MTLDNGLFDLSMFEDEPTTEELRQGLGYPDFKPTKKTESEVGSSDVGDPDFEETMKFAEHIRNYDVTQGLSKDENIMDYLGGSSQPSEDRIKHQQIIDPSIDVEDKNMNEDLELASEYLTKRVEPIDSDEDIMESIGGIADNTKLAELESQKTEIANLQENNGTLTNDLKDTKKRLKQVETLMELLLNKVSEYPKVYKEYENVVRKNAKMIRDIKG